MTADEALALDLVLGILVEPDLSGALTRAGEDAAFGALVSKYQHLIDAEQAGSEGIGTTIEPRSETWDAIRVRLASQKKP